jgi:hypothetical protein
MVLNKCLFVFTLRKGTFIFGSLDIMMTVFFTVNLLVYVLPFRNFDGAMVTISLLNEFLVFVPRSYLYFKVYTSGTKYKDVRLYFLWGLISSPIFVILFANYFLVVVNPYNTSSYSKKGDLSEAEYIGNCTIAIIFFIAYHVYYTFILFAFMMQRRLFENHDLEEIEAARKLK